MKAVVLEIRDGVAAALREDGVVIRTKQKCSVGDTIEVRAESRSVRRGVIRAVSAAAASLVLLGGIGGAYTYQNVMASSYVSLDINPSIEWVLNRRNLTIGVKALSEDGETLVDEIEKSGVRNLTLEEALDLTCEVLENEGFVAEDEEAYLLVNVTGPNEEKIGELKTAAESFMEKREPNLSLAITETSPQERRDAIDLGISPGVYQEIRTIEQADNPDIKIDKKTVEKYKDQTVRDYMEKTGTLPEKKEAAPLSENKGGNNSAELKKGGPEGKDGQETAGSDTAKSTTAKTSGEKAGQEAPKAETPKAGTEKTIGTQEPEEKTVQEMSKADTEKAAGTQEPKSKPAQETSKADTEKAAGTQEPESKPTQEASKSDTPKTSDTDARDTLQEMPAQTAASAGKNDTGSTDSSEKNEKNEQGNNPAPGMNDAGKSSRETAGEPVRESGGGSGQSRGEGGDGNRSGGDGSPAQAPGSGAPGR